MKKWLNYLPTIFILSIVLSLVFYSSQGSTVQMNYTQFEKIVDEVDFKKSSMTISSTVIQLEGTYEQNSKTIGYKVIVPRTEKNIEKLEKDLQRNGGKLTVEDPNQGSVWISILSQIIPFLIIAVFFYFMFSKMGGGGNNKAFEFAKSKARVESNVKVRFKDVAGCEEEKEEVKEIIDYLRSPKKFTDMGAHIPKGILMVGPPGTGKTLLAKAVAGEANVPFFSISGSDFVEMFVGTGASRVRDMFKTAQKSAPCIIFIDEIDAIGKSRDSHYGGGNDEREQTLNQLLAEMDGFDSNKGLLLLAATNRPEILDPALLRPGRFDRRIIVDKPDLKGRIDVLKVHAKDVKMDETVNLEEIALATSGAVGSDLANMINEAAILAVKSGRSAVSQKDLLEAVEVVLVGKEKKDRILSAQERRIVSYHEVGHALVSALQKDSEPVQKITIVPRTMGALGYVMQVPEEEKYLNTQKELEAMLVGYLGGRAAEEIVFDSVTTGASNDIEQATKVARAMITQYGMSKKFGLMGLATQENQYLNGRAVLNCGDNTATEVDHEVMELLRVSYEEAKRLISSHRKALDKIAAYLIRKETITGKEFMIIFRAVEKGMEVSDVLDAEGLKALDEAVKAEDKTDEANVDTETAESTVQAPAEMPAESSGDSEDH